MRLNSTLIAALTAVAAGSLTASPSIAGSYTALYSFGDSYIDSGNYYALTHYPPSPPYAQDLSNGPTTVAYLAQDLGIPFTYSYDPARSGKSLNYAITGAETGVFNNATGIDAPAFGQLHQVANFIGDLQSGAVSFQPASTLFLLEAGGNDLIDYFSSLPSSESLGDVIHQAATNVLAEGYALYVHGARNIGLASLFDLSLTPEGAASGFGPFLDLAAGLLNVAYSLDAAVLDTLPGANVFVLDSGEIFNNLVANAADYGFTNTTQPCLSLSPLSLCSNPDQYVFWDQLHPTTAFDKVFADALAASLPAPVPEPISLALFVSGLAGLGFVSSAVRRPG